MSKRAPPRRGLVTRQDAARLLKVSLKTLWTLRQRGTIRAIFLPGEPRTPYFRRADLVGLSRSREEEPCAASVAVTARRAHALAARAHRRLRDLEQFIGLRAYRPTTPGELVGLYREACDALTRDYSDPDPHDVRRWAERLYALDESLLEVLAGAVGDPEPWEPFYELGKKIALELPKARGFCYPPLQHALGFLETARRQFRMACYFYTRDAFGRRRADENFSGNDVDAEVLAHIVQD